MMTPGLKMSWRSKSALNPAIAARARDEYIVFSSSPRARPSPCSPESEPPYLATRSAAAVRKRRITAAS